MSNTHSLNLGAGGGLNMTRQMSAINRPQRGSDADDSRIRRHRTSNKPIGNMRERTDDLRKVYGQAVDLSEFER